jgi:ankyrin repeat protein
MVFGAILTVMLILQAQAIFADYNDDFLKEVGKNDFKAMERVLSRRANQMNLAYCMGQILENRVNGFNRGNMIQILQLLTRYGANANGRITLSGSFHLENAVKNKQPIAVIQFLLDSGADPNLSTYKIYLPLRVAYENSDMQVVNLLLDRGANGAELLINLGIRGDNEFIRRLISRGVQIRSEQGAIALRFAALKGHFDTVKLLVENGVNINARENDGYQDIPEGATATSVAYDRGEIEIYNFLKANGAIDFEPRQVAQQPTPPSSSTTNVYVQPSAPAQSAPTPAPSTPILRPGRYACSGTDVTMEIQSPLLFVSLYSGYTIVGNGSYKINGNTIVITIAQANDVISHMRGKTYAYTIMSDTSFSGSGETWYRR